MKKVFSFLLLLSLALSLVACGSQQETKEITCDEIVQAYEAAGYYVIHCEHKDETESSQLCYIKASISEDSDSDYIYFVTCFTEEHAEGLAKSDEYNLGVWFYATVMGEHRWLKTGSYGNIAYSYYNSELIEPFNELIK